MPRRDPFLWRLRLASPRVALSRWPAPAGFGRERGGRRGGKEKRGEREKEEDATEGVRRAEVRRLGVAGPARVYHPHGAAHRTRTVAVFIVCTKDH